MAEKENKEELENEVKEGVEKNENKKEQEIVPKSEYDELDDRYKRILAEFENFKKRSAKERENLYSSILSDVVAVMLPILDNLENAAKIETKDEEYKKGIELVLLDLKEWIIQK